MARVVIFGDSNEAFFGPAVKDRCVLEMGIAAKEINLVHQGGSYIQWLPKGAHWPAIAGHLDTKTELVVIGLGGNMVSTSSAHVKAVGLLVKAIAEKAPSARLVWRGPPPATAMKIPKAGGGYTTTIAGLQLKMERYRKSHKIREALVGLGFAVFGAGSGSVANKSRVYIDVISLHAGGPCPKPGGGVSLELGTAACLAYEKQALALGGKTLKGVSPASGPWTSYAHSPDHYGVHVGKKAAVDLVDSFCGPGGCYG